jgi:hypothetical protein
MLCGFRHRSAGTPLLFQHRHKAYGSLVSLAYRQLGKWCRLLLKKEYRPLLFLFGQNKHRLLVCCRAATSVFVPMLQMQ